MLAAVAKEEKVDRVSVYDVDKCHHRTGGLDFTAQRQNMASFLSGVNNMQHPVWQLVSSTLETFQPDLVGISTMTINYASALRVAELAKRWNPDSLVIMGGAHASIMPHGMIEWPYVDAVVKGEGEEAFRAILRTVGAGSLNFDNLPGVITKANRNCASAKPLEIADLDGLPFPDRDALMNLEQYTPEDMGLILTSRGCPYRCAYCSNFTRKVRFRSVEGVLTEMLRVSERFGTVQFLIKDDSFTLSRSRVETFCKSIRKGGNQLVWESTTRLDLLDDSLLEMMARSGCNRVGVGVESGDDNVLEVLGKRLTTDRIREAARLLRKHRFFWTGYFMMGLPMEREEQIMRTLAFMKELQPPYAALGIYKPYPGTKLFDLAEQMDLVSSHVTNQHFLQTNPVDYFFKDPRRRTANISYDRLVSLTAMMEKEFSVYNKKLANVLRRAKSRKALYLNQPQSLALDLFRAVRWLTH